MASDLVHNDRVKLTAGWLNTLAGGLVAAGVFTPLATLALGTAPVAVSVVTLAVLSFGCFALGLGLHFGARSFLGRLR